MFYYESLSFSQEVVLLQVLLHRAGLGGDEPVNPTKPFVRVLKALVWILAVTEAIQSIYAPRNWGNDHRMCLGVIRPAARTREVRASTRDQKKVWQVDLQHISFWDPRSEHYLIGCTQKKSQFSGFPFPLEKGHEDDSQWNCVVVKRELLLRAIYTALPLFLLLWAWKLTWVRSLGRWHDSPVGVWARPLHVTTKVSAYKKGHQPNNYIPEITQPHSHSMTNLQVRLFLEIWFPT